MIWLTEEDRELLKEMEASISKEEMQANWEAFMEITPIHSGSEEEEEAFQFLKSKLEEYGLEPEMLRYDAYISDPKYAKLKILQPLEMELNAKPYTNRSVRLGTGGPTTKGGLSVVLLTRRGWWVFSRPEPPKLRIRDEAGKLVDTISLEYG